MRYLYFDLIGGISGDMTVSSLLDISNNFKYLKEELKKINLNSYKIEHRNENSGHIKASRFIVIDSSRKERVYQFEEIKKKINSSKLSSSVKRNILSVYQMLYNAEKSVHRSKEVHFHQIGEVDSIIDIASSCILIDHLKVDRILYSTIPFGERVAPATTHMIKSKRIYLSSHQFENITPTGVAIITTLGKQRDLIVKDGLSFTNIGYGVGSVKAKDFSNLLRAGLLISRKGKA